MIDGHTLLADWLMLISWVIALLYCFILAFPERASVKGSAALLPLALAFLAAALWVL